MLRLFAFYRPRKVNIIVLIDREVKVSKVAHQPKVAHQQAAAENLQGTGVVDIQTFAQGLKECFFCKRGKCD